MNPTRITMNDQDMCGPLDEPDVPLLIGAVVQLNRSVGFVAEPIRT
jgi:hypothetical protein